MAGDPAGSSCASRWRRVPSTLATFAPSAPSAITFAHSGCSANIPSIDTPYLGGRRGREVTGNPG
eukprot:8339333-Pyramimonas_sp.AAC.1